MVEAVLGEALELAKAEAAAVRIVHVIESPYVYPESPCSPSSFSRTSPRVAGRTRTSSASSGFTFSGLVRRNTGAAIGKGHTLLPECHVDPAAPA